MTAKDQFLNLVEIYDRTLCICRNEGREAADQVCVAIQKMSMKEQGEFLHWVLTPLGKDASSPGIHRASIDLLDYLVFHSSIDRNLLTKMSKMAFNEMADPWCKIRIEMLIVYQLDSDWEGGQFEHLPDDGSVWDSS